MCVTTWYNVSHFAQAGASKPAHPTIDPYTLKQANHSYTKRNRICALWNKTYISFVIKGQLLEKTLENIKLIITHSKTQNV